MFYISFAPLFNDMQHMHTRDAYAQEERIKRLFKSIIQNIDGGIQFVE